MRAAATAFLVVLLVVFELPQGLSFTYTGPAILWSPYQDGLNPVNVKEAVSYQTLTPKDLAKSVMSEGGWSNLLCSRLGSQHSFDFAFLFLGRESLDISGHKHEDPTLVDLLKASFTKSKFSLAFPYVAASEKEAMESSLVSEFAETCGHDAALCNVAITESCAVEGQNFEKLTDIQSVEEYLVTSMEKKTKGEATLIVVCHGGYESLKGLDQSRTEGQVFSELISSVERRGAKYSALFVSDPFRSIRYPSQRQVERFLAEGAFGNESANSTLCDGVCQIKSSLLEGILVAIVLLIILISGLCCMMGIDTPTRFETPQES